MRAVVTAAHLALWALSGVLYFLFILPRWWELMGDTSHTLGTVLRIAAGVLMALAALPVLLTLLSDREPEKRTPQPAQRLRVWSVILHVLAGVLIVGTAVAEIWVSLDKGGPWLFGIYGAAAAIAVLALLAFYLAYTAELPAKAPKPKKEKKPQTAEDDAAGEDTAAAEEVDEAAAPDDEPAGEDTAAAEEVDEAAAPDDEPAVEDEQPAEVSAAAEPESESEPEASAVLLNKRPTGKTNHRLRRRNRGNVAVDE